MSWRVVLLCGMVLLAAALFTGARPSASYRATSDVFTVGCYDELSQHANTTVVPIDSSLGAEGTCSVEWQAQGAPVPAGVVTCVVSGGGTGVFPNESGMSAADACTSIGASLPDDGAHYGGLTAQEVRTMFENLGTLTEGLDRGAGPDHVCYPAPVIRMKITKYLSDSGLTSWRVRDATTAAAPPSVDGVPCADLTVDELAAELILIDGDA
jgi:hypothetical protein